LSAATGFGILAVACSVVAPTPVPQLVPPSPSPKPTEAPAEPTPTPAPFGPTTPTPVPGVTDLPAPRRGQKILKYWHNFPAGNQADAHVRQIRRFLEDSPAYAIEATFVTASGDISDRLTPAIAAGTPPDAAHWDRFLATSWAARGFLTDLTTRAQNDKVGQDLFIRESWAEATWRGRLYAVPFDTDLRGLYYNRRHFREAGLDPDKPPATIEELDAAAEKLTKRGGTPYSRLGFMPWFGQGSLYTWAWVFGGELYDRDRDRISLDAPKVVKALEWMVGYARRYSSDAVDLFASAFGPNEEEPLATGLVSAISDGDWMVATYLKYMRPEQRDDWDVAPYPRAEGGPARVTWGGGWSTIVPKGAKEPDGGWALAKYLGVDAAAMWAIETTHIPVYLPAYDELEKNKAKFDPRWRKFWPLKDVARYRPNLPVGQELWTAQSTAVHLARHFKEEPETILTRLNADVQQAYAKYRT
jgi:ABC-type glycerol-3-phosphate transport system substrate-binding protein